MKKMAETVKNKKINEKIRVKWKMKRHIPPM